MFPWTVKTHEYRLWTLENRISVILFDLKLIQQRIYRQKDLSGQLKENKRHKQLWWNGIWNESYMNCGYEIKWSYDLRSYERNFYNCVEKPEKFRTSTGFEPVTSRFRYDALTNWAMKPLTLGAGHLWVLMVPWGMNQWWNGIWNESYMNCGYEIKWSYDLRSYEREVTGSNPVEVLNFSGFSTQL